MINVFKSFFLFIMTKAIKLDLKKIKCISFDITGTLLIHKHPIMKTYAESALWAKLPNPPSAEELKAPFKQAYKEQLLSSPCFRDDRNLFNERTWWAKTVRRTLELCGREYTDEEFNRYFRRVYQHYGSVDGYELLPDTLPFLNDIQSRFPDIVLGITTNTPMRTIETVLPLVGLHDRFKFFVCCQDVGVEKPDTGIFKKSFEEASFWIPGLKKDEVLHIGDSLPADLCGARAYGFQALLLDRSGNPRVTVYQDWLRAPGYDGMTERDIHESTVTTFNDIQLSRYIAIPR